MKSNVKQLDKRIVLTAKEKVMQRALEGARRYAAADKSDPFAYDRAVCHIKNGIGLASDGQGNTIHCYDAREVEVKKHLQEGMQFSDGSTEYTGTEFRDITRP